MKQIVIIGAGSYVGTSVEKHLMQWQERYSIRTIDVREDTWRDADFTGADCMFFVAGIVHIKPKKMDDNCKKLFYKVNTELPIEVANMAKKQGVNQFIYMSSASVYGESAPIGGEKIVSESTPLSPKNVYGDSKMKAEEGLIKLNDNAFKVVLLRCPMVYGKNCKGNYVSLAKMVKRWPVFPKINNARSMIYIENLAEFVRLMIENEESGVFLPCDKEWVCTTELARLIANSHGKRLVFIPGVGWGLKILGKFFGVVNKAFGNFVYAKESGNYKEEYRKYTLEEAIQRTEK